MVASRQGISNIRGEPCQRVWGMAEWHECKRLRRGKEFNDQFKHHKVSERMLRTLWPHWGGDPWVWKLRNVRQLQRVEYVTADGGPVTWRTMPQEAAVVQSDPLAGARAPLFAPCATAPWLLAFLVTCLCAKGNREEKQRRQGYDLLHFLCQLATQSPAFAPVESLGDECQISLSEGMLIILAPCSDPQVEILHQLVAETANRCTNSKVWHEQRPPEHDACATWLWAIATLLNEEEFLADRAIDKNWLQDLSAALISCVSAGLDAWADQQPCASADVVPHALAWSRWKDQARPSGGQARPSARPATQAWQPGLASSHGTQESAQENRDRLGRGRRARNGHRRTNIHIRSMWLLQPPCAQPPEGAAPARNPHVGSHPRCIPIWRSRDIIGRGIFKFRGRDQGGNCRVSAPGSSARVGVAQGAGRRALVG